MSMSFRKKAVMVSDLGCGKASLLTRMATGYFPTGYRPCVHETFIAEGEVDGKHIELALWEVVALEEFERLRPLSYMGAHVILICFAIDDPDSLENVSKLWAGEVRQYCPNRPIILIGCKIDLRDNTGTVEGRGATIQQLITPDEGEMVAQKIGAEHYLECSAKTGEGVSEVFQHASWAALSVRDREKKCSGKCIII